MNAVIVDGWNLFDYNGPNKEPGEPNIKLVASKYLNHNWEIYIDFYAAHDSRFKLYKDGELQLIAESTAKDKLYIPLGKIDSFTIVELKEQNKICT